MSSAVTFRFLFILAVLEEPSNRADVFDKSSPLAIQVEDARERGVDVGALDARLHIVIVAYAP
jgi:hypothetical protein